MTKRDVQDYLDQAMYGTPQLKPDEQRKYLGTFRERVYLSMTIDEMKNKANVAHLQTEIATHPDQQILINAEAPFDLQNTYMKVAQQTNCPFRIVETDQQKNGTAIGLIYIADEAVNVDVIAVSKKYGPTPAPKPVITPSTSSSDTPEEAPAKKGFFKNLFS